MSFKTCPECGYKTESNQKQCQNCGNRDFDKATTYNKPHENDYDFEAVKRKILEEKNTEKNIETNENYYENEISCKLKNWADGLFVVSIIIGIILIIIFWTSLEDFSNEYEKIHNYSNLYYGILFILIAPIEKLLINAKAEQIELLHQINSKIRK